MSGEVRFYKGKFRVKVMTESKGNWIVEALEPFEDMLAGQRVKVRVGEQRIVPPNLLFEREGLPPPVKEHVYELKMEKRLKKLLSKEGEREEPNDLS